MPARLAGFAVGLAGRCSVFSVDFGLGGSGVKIDAFAITRTRRLAHRTGAGGGGCRDSETAGCGRQYACAPAGRSAVFPASGLGRRLGVLPSPITGRGSDTTGAGVGSAGWSTTSGAALTGGSATSVRRPWRAVRLPHAPAFRPGCAPCASRSASRGPPRPRERRFPPTDSTGAAVCGATAGAGVSAARVTSTRFLRTSTCTVRDLPDASAVRNSVVDLRVSVMRLPALSSAAPCCLRR